MHAVEDPHRSTARGGRAIKLVAFSLAMLIPIGWISVVSGTPLFRVDLFASPQVNGMVSYQLSALIGAVIALVLTFVFAGKVRLRYLSVRRTGQMRPFFANPGGGRWETEGWFLGVIMVAIVALVTFFQFFPGGFDFTWVHVALVVPLAAMNAFTEEAIFRVPYVTMGANETNSHAYGLVMGSVVFGALHYWGAAPNGIIGAVMSALLGFVLAKSIQETGGVFWAFTIHFMLDLPIVLFILNQAP